MILSGDISPADNKPGKTAKTILLTDKYLHLPRLSPVSVEITDERKIVSDNHTLTDTKPGDAVQYGICINSSHKNASFSS
jgi:hypothetical protein